MYNGSVTILLPTKRSTFNVNIKQKAAERIKRLSEKLGCDKYNLKRLIKGLVPSALSLAVVLAGFSLFSRQHWRT